MSLPKVLVQVDKLEFSEKPEELNSRCSRTENRNSW